MEQSDKSWHFLVNPVAGRGKAGRKWRSWLPRLEAALPSMTWAESTAREGMSHLAEMAVRSGKQYLVGVGGDGTHHDILNGIAAAGGLEDVIYAPLPLGSGNDWVRTLKTPRNTDAWLIMLEAAKTISHSVGQLHYPESAADSVRYFLNVAGMAYDAEVLRRADASPFKHRFLYPFMTLAFLRDYTAPTVHIEYDDQQWEGPVHTINLGLGRYSGGGMRLVPHAEPTNETFALTFAQRLPLWRIVLESWRFYAGSIGRVKGVTLATVKTVKVTVLSGHLELEADGEWLGNGAVRASVHASRLRVVTNTVD